MPAPQSPVTLSHKKHRASGHAGRRVAAAVSAWSLLFSTVVRISLSLFRLRLQVRIGLTILALAASLSEARAGLSLDLHLYNNNNYYFVEPFLSASGTGAVFPVGDYTISPPNFPASGLAFQYQAPNGTVLTYVGSIIGGPDYTSFPALMASITNGHWTIQVTNATSTNTYTFTVSAPALPPDVMVAAEITYPTEGIIGVASQPDFTWQGPAGWEGALYVQDVTNDSLGYDHLQAQAALSGAQTSWIPSVTLPAGTNRLQVDYQSNATAILVATVPMNGSLQPISSWTSTATLETWALSHFSVGAVLPPAPWTQGHRLIAQYPFNLASFSPYSANDVSVNNNSIYSTSGWGDSYTPQSGATWIAGGGSLLLDGGECYSLYSPPGSHAFDNWLATFYGSFSVSLWLNTTTVVGNDSDALDGNNGASIIWAYNNGVNDTIPIALTGHKVAFFTGDPSGNNGDTLHSTASVTSGSFVHVVVTRDQLSGQKAIYINGALDSTDIGATNCLDGDTTFYSIGGNGSSSYTGLLDDVQIYLGVLNSNEVAYLYAHPGVAMTNVPGPSSGPVAYYDFDEGVDLAADLTANGNNLIYGGNFRGPVLSPDSVSGSGAVYLDGGCFLTASANLLPTLAGDFSLSLWVNTTQSTVWDTAPASYGVGIVSADVPGQAYDLIPVALTGGSIAFNTGGTSDDTINSTIHINDGTYHHVVVTRNQATGAKQIYIDGVLNVSDVATPGLLNAPQLITIGAVAAASNPDPASPEYTGSGGFEGLIDDIQFYSRVLTPTEVAALHATPGSTASGGLVCNYDFDDGADLAADVSGHGNNMVFMGTLSAGPGPALTNDTESGSGALLFNGYNYLVPEGSIVTNLARSFSVSVWLKTTQTLGDVGDPADTGAGVVTAGVAAQSFDCVPLALTGGNVAFGTDGATSDTLTSTTPINDGNYHHVVVTRDQGTGQKKIYIDGVLNAVDTADTSVLNNPAILTLGALADASQSYQFTPSFTGYNGYLGEMDSLQIYSRAISPAEVAFLYNNPGATIPIPVLSSGDLLGAALGATNLVWSTSGDVGWFVETTNTYSTNAAAAQSGSLQENQTSLLQATVTGPGILSFYWQTAANNDDFDLEFDMDGSYKNDIGGQTPWQQFTLEIDDSSTHTLTWNANTLQNNGSSPTDAGYVDQVVFTPYVAPVITLNPFNQTNYPGYPVALLAAATGTPAPTWQWYGVGSLNPIPGATNALFTPANSGTSGVAGSYCAVAANIAGSQTTSTAMVTFVSAPLPPDWTEAFKSPFENNLVASDVYYACTVDSTGTNIFSVGNSAGTNDFFGTNEIRNLNGDYAAVIVKQTAAKATQWVVAITNNGNGSAYAEEVAPAPGGGVYAAGQFSGTNWLGNTLLEDSGGGTYFLAEFDANGNKIWMQTASNSFPFLNTLVADPGGNVTAVLTVSGSTTIGGSNLTAGGTYLAQFSPGGTLNWVELVPEAIFYLQYNAGRIYASLGNGLNFSTNAAIGGLTNSTDRSWTVAAINAANGHGIWLHGVGEALGAFPGGNVDDYPEIAVSGSNVFLVGTAYGSSTVFGSITIPIADGRGQYFARYDTNGNPQIATGFGSPTTQPEAAVADAAGNVYVAGNFDTWSLFGSRILAAPRLNTLTNSHSGHAGYFGQAFTAEFDREGTPQWARMAESTHRNIQGTEMVNFYDIALAPAAVWVCGFGNDAAWFGTNLVNSAGAYIVPGGEGIVNPIFESFNSGMLGMIAVTPPPGAVVLLNPEIVGANFQFQFLSQSGFTHSILCQSDIAAGACLTNATVAGDGAMKTISIPLSVLGSSKAGFVRVLTQ
jgi:hypothetical protein